MKSAADGAEAPQGGSEVETGAVETAGRLRETAPISGAEGSHLPGSAPTEAASSGMVQSGAAQSANTSAELSDAAAVAAAGDSLASDSGHKRQKHKAMQSGAKGEKRPWSRKKKIIVAIVVILLLGALAAALVFVFLPRVTNSEIGYTSPETEHYYSVLTGEEIMDERLNSSPTYCMQIPNGTDISPRTHVGLQYAGVVFEAIAEAGITRFAAVFQNVDTAMLGPIRSLRTYYLEWDTPFDCTIVHAGGADDALAALKTGGYRDLTESTTYMWRNTTSYRAPNNLFTSSALLADFNNANGFTSSEIKGFARMTPDAASAAASENLRKSTEGDVVEAIGDDGEPTTKTVTTPLVSDIRFNFGNNNNYNVVYAYNTETNSYDRGYANGNAHWSYDCGTEETNPANCEREQLSPSVVIAMVVEERRASDGYHEDITALGNGAAYIFQNGTVIAGTWQKASADDQIQFFDEAGNAVELGVGQTWISAVPSYGSVEY